MKEEQFRSWLATHRNLRDRTIGSRISNCRTVERYEGDLDSQFDQDQLQHLTRRLTYSSRDQVANRPALHNIPIDGNIYNGTATLRSAVSLYRQFRESTDEGTQVPPRTRNPRRVPARPRSDTTTIVQRGLVLSPGTVLQNRYRIISKLGAGGMGAVYQAVDQRLNSVVALKKTLTETPELSRAFEREASLLANLHHPALPVVIDHFLDADGQFLVMQFIQGDDLATSLEKRGVAFPVPEVVKWAYQLLDALDYLHQHDPPIVHRDIKPLNIKLGRSGQTILLDFGLAKGAIGQMATMTAGASIFGYSPLYAPLEQMHGVGTDPRSDIYSLGVTLYHLITGSPPVDAPTRYNAIEEGRSDPLRPASTINSEVTESLSNVLKKAMAIGRRERWGSSTEMRYALENALSTGSNPSAAGGFSQTYVDKSVEEEPKERVAYFNNCQNRNHVKIHGPDAFYDLNTTGFQSSLARDLPVGQKCVVATTGSNDEIVFSWFSFLREDVRRDDRGVPCRVFFGRFIKSEQYLKAEAARREPYSSFFDINGNFKRHSVIEGMIAKEPNWKARARSRTTEKEFFERLQNRSPAEAYVAKRILDWSKENFTQVNWKGSSFVPVLQYGAQFSHNPITVHAVGKVPRVGIKFGRMKRRNGLPEEKRRELLQRLNNIPGVSLGAETVDKYPNILLTSLTDPNALEQFLRAIKWTNEQIKALPKQENAN